MRRQILHPHSLPYNDIDLCILLANALDNAMEACIRQGLTGKIISVGFQLVENKLFIKITNPVVGLVDGVYETMPSLHPSAGHQGGKKEDRDRPNGAYRSLALREYSCCRVSSNSF